MAYCHKLIKSTAQGIAGSFYEVAASADDFYKLHPSQPRFIRLYWQQFLKPARETLANMLALPGYTDHVKAEIHQALLLDNTVPSGGKHRVIDR